MNIGELLDILEASNSREFLYKPLSINRGQGCSFVIIKESKSKEYKFSLLLSSVISRVSVRVRLT